MLKQIAILIFFALAPFILQGQGVEAGFSISNHQGCSPLQLNFDNHSEGSNLSYHWDLGNGNTSTLENPGVIYTEPGTYSIRLIVSNNFSSDTLTLSDTVHVYASPQPTITINSETDGCSPFELSVSANTEGASNGSTYRWDFGTGSISEGQSITKTFNQAGQYDILLSEITQHGCFASTYMENAFDVYEAPTFDFTANQSSFCNTPASVEFTVNTGIPEDADILWDFGDGNTSVASNPSHVYTDFGSYTVSCTIITTEGCSRTVTKSDMIEIAPVDADFIPADTVFCNQQSIDFTNLSSGFSHTEWDFGDGATSSQVNPQHTYSTAGSYEINLRVWNDDGCEMNATHSIHIETVEADFTLSETSLCELPAFVEYQSETENAVAWEWHTELGVISQQENLHLLYTDSVMGAGTNYQRQFTDSLIVTGPMGCTDTAIHNDGLNIDLPRAYFTPNNLPAFANEVRGCAPLSIDFNYAAIYTSESDNIESVHWNFGDGTTSNEYSPAHTWTETGEYLVRMTVTTVSGCSNSFEALIEVGSQQTADFIHNIPDTICASDYISLLDQSENDSLIDQWIWNFSDGGVSIMKNPSYHFTDTGSMNASLVVGYNGCMSAPATQQNITYAKGPVVEFTYAYDCDEPLSYHFSGEFIDADAWYWDMGDGHTGFHNQETVDYSYAEAGNYTVKLIAENHENACSYTSQKTVKPRRIASSIAVDTSYGCSGLTVTANGDQSRHAIATDHDGEWGTYHWIVDNGLVDSVSSQAYSHTFTSPGEHTIKLIVSDRNGCLDTSRQIISIHKPSARIHYSNSTGCAPHMVNFSSQVASDAGISDYYWSFGDGSGSQNANPQHVFTSGGNFLPELTVTDTLGCSTTISADSTIVSIQPSAQFTSNDQALCVGETIILTPDEEATGVQYHWELSNGAESNGTTPEFTLSQEGNYDVSLSVIDENGCTNQQTRQDYIDVESYPQIDFYADNTSAACYPAEISFQSTSTQMLSSYTWDFGDSSMGSDLAHPIHNHTQPGINNVSLIGGTNNGCTDTATIDAYIEIGGPSADIIIPDTTCPGAVFNARIANASNVENCLWDMGNGALISNDSIEYSYNTAGDYQPVVMLQADDNHTCDKAFTMDVNVPGFYADFTTVDQVCRGESFHLTNTSAMADEFVWHLGRENTTYESEPEVSIQTAGEHTIYLIASADFGNTTCVDTTTNNIQVNPTPIAEFGHHLENPHRCVLPKTVWFTNESSGANQYAWNLAIEKDREVLFDQSANPQHSFETSGTYDVQLISTNEFGCSDSVTHPVTINPIPEVSFSLNNKQGCEPFETQIHLTNATAGVDKVIKTQWTLGDGTQATEQSPAHTYAAGTYPVSLAYEMENGCRDTISKDSLITVFPTPKADFTYESADPETEPEKYGEVQFFNHSGGGTSPYTVNWDFGDGFTSPEASPLHRYASNTDFHGNAFTASMLVSDKNGCRDSLTKTVHIDYFNGLFVPNAIIPNSRQGEQDIFLPKGKSLESYHLEIFTRHGKKIFETSELSPIDGSPQEAWNGKYNGRTVEKGVYVWKIEARFSDGNQWNYTTKSGKTTNTGTVLVIR